MDTWLIVLLFLVTAPLWFGYVLVGTMLIGTAFVAVCVGAAAFAVALWEAFRK